MKLFKWINNYQKNYTDQMARTIITSKFAKSKINVFVIMFATILCRNIICALICLGLTFNPYIDFFLHSFIYILFMLNSSLIYDALMGKKEFFYEYTRYYINSYTEENYRRWKRNITLSISSIGILYLYFVEITSELLIIWILQSLLIYFVIDQIENRKFTKLIKTIKSQPKPKLHTANKLLIDTNYQVLDETKDNKPGTKKIKSPIVKLPSLKVTKSKIP